MWEQTVSVLKKYLYLPDINYVAVLASCVLTVKFRPKKPPWLLAIGASGWLKSELLNSFRHTKFTHYESCLNPAGLVSGWGLIAGTEDVSLLGHIDGKVLIVDDFSAIMGLPVQKRDELFGMLRQCFDGEFSKQFGVGRRVYRLNFGLMCAVTEEIEHHRYRLQQLGDRFLNLRSYPPQSRVSGLDFIQEVNQQAKEEAIRGAIGSFIEATKPEGYYPKLPHYLLEAIVWLCKAKATVPRGVRGEIIGDPIQEEGGRMLLQLQALARAAAGFTDWQVVLRRVMADTVPLARARVLRELLTERPLSGHKSHVYELLADMRAIGLLNARNEIQDKELVKRLLL